MNSDRPQSSARADAQTRTLDHLLIELLELDAVERSARLLEIPAMQRPALAALLAAAMEEDDFLRPGGALSAELIDAVLADDAPSLDPGSELGAYRIIKEIGAGGMGRVYLGERADGLFARKVAIKLVSPGAAATSLDRMQREQRILAELVHPHVARLYDAGVTDQGAPYLVMEHVDGEPINSYCSRLELDTKSRLRLLIDVCAAVEAAHQRLIVHRDIKPSNILVDTSGTAKLLDFGIARMLESDEAGPLPGSALTEPVAAMAQQLSVESTGTFGRARLTPNYASPEQLAGAPTTTSSDVYQLGLLVWELLVGRRPDADEIDALRSSTRTKQAFAMPDSVAHVLPIADVAAVVIKALAVEPGQRYPTADRLREDLLNLLEGHPVTARRSGSLYRLRRLAARHKLASMGSVIVVLLLLGLSIAYAVRIAAERDATRLQAEQAERARLETEQVVEFLGGLFRASDPYARDDGRGPGELSARELLDHSSEQLQTALSDQPLARARLLSEVARIYRQLGLLDQSEPLARESLRLREATSEVRPADLAQSRLALGRIHLQRGHFDEAAKLIDSAVRLYANTDDRRGLASALEAQGNLLEDLGKPEAIESFARSLAIWQALGVVEREADLRLFLANALIRNDRIAEARTHREAALKLQVARFGPSHPAVAAALVGIADLHKNEGAPQLAVPLLERALKIYETSFGVDDFRVAVAANNLGLTYADQGDPASARPYLQRALAIYQVARPDHPSVGQILDNLGTLDWAEGKPAAAAKLYRQALAQLRRTLPDVHILVLQARFNLGEALMALKQFDEAEPLLKGSLDGLAAKIGTDNVALSGGWMYLAQIAERRGELDRAEDLLKRALARREATPGQSSTEISAAREALQAFQTRHPRSGSPAQAH
jgi:eukaryotic-like serine/threonine-protein kinase